MLTFAHFILQTVRLNATIPEVRILGSDEVYTTPDKPIYLNGEAVIPCGALYAGKHKIGLL